MLNIFKKIVASEYRETSIGEIFNILQESFKDAKGLKDFKRLL